MPYPNFHACRLQDPNKYPKKRYGSRRSRNGKVYNIIWGITSPGKSEEQAYRYSKSTWSASEAKSHCSRHGGSFEPASGGSQSRNYFALILNAISRRFRKEN